MLCLSVAPQFPCCRGNFIIVCMPAATTRGRLLHMAVYISSMSHKLSFKSMFTLQIKIRHAFLQQKSVAGPQASAVDPPRISPVSFFLFLWWTFFRSSSKNPCRNFLGDRLRDASDADCRCIGCGFRHRIRAETSFGSDVCEWGLMVAEGRKKVGEQGIWCCVTGRLSWTHKDQFWNYAKHFGAI